ncbi:PilN domain-containing protein [Neisseria sp. ZJ106]|uniref:PilN domain-containing protein n=1 Tax=Neisseria lisongii TaxID=2912188 RepID=A0ABY7RI55_9NEIS|nr:PilN domain-containing protein [Neisseria lisongii]MCF7522130.1 PilN domain-containing protein [Neisseria lisongii]WCL70957.1 PilN domain-containing protein [Neisseria lisongii]
MIELIAINLLPYRQALETQRKRQFALLMSAAAALACTVSLAGYLLLEHAVSQQTARNRFLEHAASTLDQDLARLRQLQNEKDALIRQRQHVEQWQRQTEQTARLPDILGGILPEQAYLTDLTADSPHQYRISGKAAGEAEATAFLAALNRTPQIRSPELADLKADGTQQAFTVKFSLTAEPPTGQPSEP